jgi:hypothetical protein
VAAGSVDAGHNSKTSLCPDSSVTWLLQDGVPAFEVAGFATMDIETLQSVYGHHAPDFQQRVASAHGRRTSAQDTPKKPTANGVNERHAASTKPSKV